MGNLMSMSVGLPPPPPLPLYMVWVLQTCLWEALRFGRSKDLNTGADIVNDDDGDDGDDGNDGDDGDDTYCYQFHKVVSLFPYVMYSFWAN